MTASADIWRAEGHDVGDHGARINAEGTVDGFIEVRMIGEADLERIELTIGADDAALTAG